MTRTRSLLIWSQTRYQLRHGVFISLPARNRLECIDWHKLVRAFITKGTCCKISTHCNVEFEQLSMLYTSIGKFDDTALGASPYLPEMQTHLAAATNLWILPYNCHQFKTDHGGMFLCFRIDPVVQTLHYIYNNMTHSIHQEDTNGCS